MTAQYYGWCVDCGQRIAPGDMISKRKRGWIHSSHTEGDEPKLITLTEYRQKDKQLKLF